MSAPVTRPVPPFAVATFIPVLLLLLSGLFGGAFILVTLIYLFIAVNLIDSLVATAGQKAAPGITWEKSSTLSEALVGAHIVLLPLGIAAVTGTTGLGFLEGLGALVAFGLFFGLVSSANAHVLLQSGDGRLHKMGKWVFVSLLFGHHATAHSKIHNRFVATPEDPCTAELTESFYHYAPRAWGESALAGWEIERSIASVEGKELPIWRHPYAEYIGLGLAFMFAVVVVFGGSGLVAYLLIAAVSQVVILLIDYVQHYGLTRRKLDDDSYEPIAPWHAWNSAHWFSSGLLLNATRHSHQHMEPSRPFPELAVPDASEGPRLPHSLPMMATLALIPPLFHRKMDRRAATWLDRIQEGRVAQSQLPLPEGASSIVAQRTTGKAQAVQQPVSKSETDAVTERVTAALAADLENDKAVEEPVSEKLKQSVEQAPEPSPSAGRDGEREAAVINPPSESEADELIRNLRNKSIDPAPAPAPKRSTSEEPKAATADLWSSEEETQPGAPPETLEGAAATSQPPPPDRDSDKDRTDAASAESEAASVARDEDKPQDPEETPGQRRRSRRTRPRSAVEAPVNVEAIEAAVAKYVQGDDGASGRERRRRRSRLLPELEPAQDQPELDFKGRVRVLGQSAVLAARAVSAVLSGTPTGPRH